MMRRPKGFTLIELLVAISVIALLMAILMPALQRVRKQAKAVACQSNLKQWGTMFNTYLTDWDGRCWTTFGLPDNEAAYWISSMKSYYYNNMDVLLCPSASRLPDPQWNSSLGRVTWSPGGKSVAWGRKFSQGRPNQWEVYSSYNHNALVRDYLDVEGGAIAGMKAAVWRPAFDTGQHNVPLLMDSVGWLTYLLESSPPPEVDAPAQWDWESFHDLYLQTSAVSMCMDRHDGGINCLFLDWSVRKVGLKELWTLRWHRYFDTANKWTKAGGVKPEDWPEWMRNFKDY
jgi:prepilin-type N-terminal cleavage/methylation domain-containing protein/prepilin-type processing-associated H-X9-DG protein